MELRFDNCDYKLTGTPREIWEFMTLDNEPEQVAPVTIQTATTPAVVETPAPEPKPGRWKRIPHDGIYCTACSKGWSFMLGAPSDAENYRYCPFCGANMGGDEANDE